jgi:DNA polymerase-3 subunit delta
VRAGAAYNARMFLLFHGPDEFSAREELARVRQAHDFSHNVDTFAGAEGDLNAILTTCDTVPFLSEQRLVVVEGLPKRRRAVKGEASGESESDAGEATAAKAASKGKGKKGKAASGPDPKAFAQALADHVPHLPEATVLVVLVDEPLEAGHPLMQAAQQHGRARMFTPPKGERLEEWLVKRAGAAGVRLAPDAARLLAAEVGENPRLLAVEVDKLATYAGAGGTIAAKDVRALTPAAHTARVFDLTDALARRDRTRALALLHELLAAGESPFGIIALTAFQTRALLQVKTLAERGLRPYQIAQSAGMAPYVVEKSLPLARQFTFAQLEAAHRALLDVDTALKHSRMTPELALDLLVVEFGNAAAR